MIVYRVEIQLHAPWVHSLKEKRMVVKSVTGKLSNKFNISVIEASNHDEYQTIGLGIALASTSQTHANSIIDNILNEIEMNSEATIVDIVREEV